MLYVDQALTINAAHVIRNASTKQCITACALKSQYRWCLTGTPIQNAVEDFGSLLQFLRINPFDNPSSFKHEIADWIKVGEEKGMTRLRLLVSAVCLRRTKECLRLPPRKSETQRVILNNEEKQLHEIYRRNTVDFIDFVFRGNIKLKSFATVIQQILRLRQICDHGKEMLSLKTIQNMDDYISTQGSKGDIVPSTETALCGACGRKVEDFYLLLRCLHPACRPCSDERDIATPDGELECMICAGTAYQGSNEGTDVENESETHGVTGIEYRPSSKVAALLQNLRTLNHEHIDPPIKRYSDTLVL